MPAKFNWSEPQDSLLRRMRAQGASWDDIATVFGVSRWTAIERGRRIGARVPPPQYVPEPEDPDREPMPPGDPRSWNAINAGTVLEGEPYPLPVFPR